MKQNIENGSRYATIKNILQTQERVNVIGEIVAEPKVNGRKGIRYTDTKLVVAPTEGMLNESDLNNFATSLLANIAPVNQHGENEQGKVTLNSFDRLGWNNFHRIAVEVYPSQEAARQVLPSNKRA